HRPAPRRDQLHQPRLGRTGPRLPRLARLQHHRCRNPPTARPTPPAPRSANADTTTHQADSTIRSGSGLTSTTTEPRHVAIYTAPGTPPIHEAHPLTAIALVL